MIVKKCCGVHALRIAVGITMLVFFLLTGSASSMSNSSSGTGRHYSNASIYSADRALADYQTPVLSSFGAGMVRTDGLQYIPYEKGLLDKFHISGMLEANGTPNITWATKASMPTSRAAMFRGRMTIGDKIYVVGGWNGAVLNAVEVYDVSENNWMTVAPLPSPRLDGAIQVVNGKLYIIGGNNNGGGGAVSDVWEYDPVTNTYTSKASFSGRRSLASAVVDGKIFTISGVNTSNADSSIVEMYDPFTNTWTSKAPHPSPRQYMNAEAVNGKIYTFGGNVKGNLVHEYDPTADSWTQKSSMPVYIGSPNSIVVNGKIFAVGGDQTKAVWMYDPLNDVWQGPLNNEIPTPRALATTAEVNGKIYVIGGCCPAPDYNVNEEGTIFYPMPLPVHNINKGTNYYSIQSAINDARQDDEIQVDSGTYYENVNVNKQLTLRGIGMPVVDARGSASAITLSANGITLEGFIATGSSDGPDAGIKVTSSNNTLSGNNASNNGNGISLGYSSKNKIYNNIFKNTNNVNFFGSNINTWNTTRQSSTNIIGGHYIGGNFWANPNGTGFSQTCPDVNVDGICDQSYILDANNIDYLPISMNFTKDRIPPKISFTNPTPANGAILAQNYAYINTTVSHASTAFIDWNRSLVGWWRFNSEKGENTTFFKDWSSWRNNAICSGTNCPVPTSGKFGKALDFDGANDYVDAGNGSSLNITGNLTVEAWVKPERLETAYLVKKATRDSTDGYELSLSKATGKAYFRVNQKTSGNTYKLFSTSKYPLDGNTWVHLVGVYNRDQVQIYFNGNLENSMSGPTNILSNTDNLKIGGTDLSRYFKGPIDEVRIWNRALNPEEIKASYNAGRYRLYRNFTNLANGVYNYRAYAQNLQGNVKQTRKMTLTLITATIITVPDDYAKIQWAIDNATAGDIIKVHSGTYNEIVNVNKKLTLRGIGMPVVDARVGIGSAITLSANGITLEGFTATGSYIPEAGIKVLSSNNTLSGNNASNNYYGGSGISLESSSNNTLTGNNVSNNEGGIWLNYSSNNTLTGNNVSNNYHGIDLYYSSNNTIYNNIFRNTKNAFDYGNNLWNIPKMSGNNIINGAFLGGNFWSDYAGKDTDGDGLGDTKLPHKSSGGIANGGDYLPYCQYRSD